MRNIPRVGVKTVMNFFEDVEDDEKTQILIAFEGARKTFSCI